MLYGGGLRRGTCGSISTARPGAWAATCRPARSPPTWQAADRSERPAFSGRLFRGRKYRTKYEYDSLNRLEVLTHYRPDEWVYDDSDLTILTDNLAVARYEYTVRADGKRTAVTETLGYDLDGEFQPDVEETIEIDWFYDNLGRLIEEDYDSTNNALDFTADYVFDLVGNRLTKTVDQGRDAVVDEVITYEYDLNDRLLTESLDSDVPQANGVDQTTTYGYDQTRQTSKTVWQGTDTDPQTGTRLSETAYGYNLQGRMSKVEIDSDGNGDLESRIEYEYDNSGIRVAQTVTEDSDNDGDLSDETPQRTDYHVDCRNPTGYAQVLEEMNGATGQVVKSYTFGLDCIEEAVAAGVYRHLTDGHGSTRALVDALGVVIQSGSTPQIYAYLCPCKLAIADFSADSSCPGTEKRVGGAGGGDSSPCSPAGGGRNRARRQAGGAHPWQDARAAGLEARAWRFLTVNVITLAG